MFYNKRIGGVFMFCSNCGRDINNNTVCPYCGYNMNYNNTGQSNFNNQPNFNNQSHFTNLNNFNNYDNKFNKLKPYYQQEFSKFDNNGAYKGRFNICAFLFANLWALTKGLWVLPLISFASILLVDALIAENIYVALFWWIFWGLYGNKAYYKKFKYGKQL